MSPKSETFQSLEIKANYNCNSRCTYCCAGNRSAKNTMSFEEISANIGHFMDKHGIRELCLSGGEPTIHKSFTETLQFAHGQGLRVYLHTNAIRFAKPGFAEQHAPFLNRVLVGLSCHDEQSCAELTGLRKSLGVRMDGIRNLLRCGVPVRSNTVVLRSNFRHLPETGRQILSLGVKHAMFTLPFFFERKEHQVQEFVPPDLDTVTPYLRQTLELLAGAGISVYVQGLPPCRLGPFEQYAEVDPDRAFVDWEHQIENHSTLFSGMLGYTRDQRCDGCKHACTCWGFPAPGALGGLEQAIGF
jgi:MoaA/NifB/PqqE/SkfB family radical SAM enzyme